MPVLNEIRHYELEPGVCVAQFHPAGGRIAVVAGTLWLTLEGEAADYWLQAGDSLVLAPRQRAWLSAERGNARFQVDRPVRTRPAAGAMRQTRLLPGLAAPVGSALRSR